MKKINVAINGFGRIGRVIARSILSNPNSELKLVAVNDLVPADNLAYLLKYDSTHGPIKNVDLAEINGNIVYDAHGLYDNTIKCFQEKDPSKLPWKDLDIDIVFECTGFFVTTEAAKIHLQAGAKKVIIGAPAKDDTPMYVYGVNHFDYKNEEVISMASCTTNCLAPIMKILDEKYGVEEALMCTIHSITATQRNLDGPSKKDWRGGRACGESIIPSSTGAAKAVAKVLPNLKGKITGNSYRVPTKDGSIVDLTVKLKTETSLKDIINEFTLQSKNELLFVLGTTNEELVSSDILGYKYSSLIDVKSCIELNNKFFKIVSWYDNESGYSERMIDMAIFINNYVK